MKKRFTLMMMVLCILMSIPLKMMAETVTIHFVDEDRWSDNGGKIYAYVYKGNAFLIKAWPRTECNDIQIVGGKKVATWTLNLGDGVTASEAGIVFNNNKGSQYPAKDVLWNVQNGLYYYPNGTTSTTPPSEGGSSETTATDIYAVSHYNNGGKWEKNDNFIFTLTDKKIYTCELKDVPANETVYFRIVKNDKEWGPNSGSNLKLTSEYQTIYQVDNSSVSLQIGSSSVQSTYTITYDSENNRIKCTSTSGSGTGGSATDDTWAETENRLKGRVYTQGYYLAGNFFSFSGEKVTYDDAVFKFQQQKNDDDGNAVYMVEIPASLTAHAQVMRVNEFGKAVKVYGPGSAYGISRTCPETDKTIIQSDLKSSETLNETLDGDVNKKNYWNIVSRNESETEYSDGMYKVSITVDKKSGEPSKWQFKHIPTKRVAYFISDAKNATALPVYDSRKGVTNGFSNKFYGTVSFSADHSYYVIANYVQDRNNENFINYTKDKYKTCKPNIDIVPTTNKLFLLGNGGLDFKDASPNNEFSPNEDPMKPGSYAGSFVAEFNPSNGVYEQTNTKKHLGIRGQVQKRIYGEIITSISMVGDAIPGTLKVDEKTGKEVWDYASTAADMTYDETDKCYKVTIVTTVDDNGKSKFRFVGNHKQNINWHEDTKDDAKMKAKTPYTGGGDGHAATPYDPNKISYTSDNANPGEDYHIIWNRPAGRWTVRLYFYTYNVDGKDVTDYYYTITVNNDLVLRDFDDVVYKTEGKRDILYRGGYKFFRTWSDSKAWKISKDVDIFIVDNMTEGTNGVEFSLKKISDETNNVIPANLGVILATKEDATTIDGGGKFYERPSLTSYNTLVIPMEEYTGEETTADYSQNRLVPMVEAGVVPTYNEKTDEYNYLFGFFRANKGMNVTTYEDNQFLLGFWLSKGAGLFYSNSAYLPVKSATAAKMKLGTKYGQFEKDPNTGNSKYIPALLFDFANVGGTTGINEVVNQSTKLNDGKYYTLSGQQVEKPTAGGIYIHNGRKFVVK